MFGALALAYPFFAGQRVRDLLLLISQMRVPDPQDKKVVEDQIRDIARDVANNMGREYTIAWIGGVMIALAFVGRLISTFIH